MSEEYDDFIPDDWEFCDGFCQVCEMQNRCVKSPYFRYRVSKEEVSNKQ